MSSTDLMSLYRAKRDKNRVGILAKYSILGFISSGTYGRVYKAQAISPGSGHHKKDTEGRIFAIKKFKPDNAAHGTGNAAKDSSSSVGYSGISQSAIREIALNREIRHDNVVLLQEVILEDKAIHMVFEYAEHDFLQLIHHHSQTIRAPIPTGVLKSLTFQLLNGLLYLHHSHIMHRDLKPANILITALGKVKIGDLGLARIVKEPLATLVSGDKVVVTIWYRAPELLMGARHYGMAVDCWAVGCVIAELASLRPVFKGEEAKANATENGGKKNHTAGQTAGIPFQRDQVLKILEVLGTPTERDWPGVVIMPEYQALRRLSGPDSQMPNRLEEWCQSRIRSSMGYDLLKGLFRYDPEKRFTAGESLAHRWFSEDPTPTTNAFANVLVQQLPPHRRITLDEGPSSMMPTHPAASASHQGGASRKKARLG